MFSKKKEPIDFVDTLGMWRNIRDLEGKVAELEDVVHLKKKQIEKLISLHPSSSVFRKLT